MSDHVFFKNGILKKVKNIEKFHMDSEKSINLFEIKKDRSTDYLLNNYFVYQFVNNFLALLLCKIHDFDFFDFDDFFQIFVISRKNEILIELSYWLGMYVPYIFKVFPHLLCI